MSMSASQTRATNPESLLIGDSQPMRDLEEEILLAAGAEVTVLITGESGVGKEMIAREIHRRSDRAKGPFIAVNCGAVTESLLEAKLFGHVRGAFTGASGAKGLFEAADGGTILLDEIGDMPQALQAYLLRVLQERAVTPVGSHIERKVDVRIIAATNKDLRREIEEGRFRQDLYYRLNELPIRAPALRERPADIPLLVRHFLGSVEIEEDALELLRGYHWPGNVRELKAAIKRLTLRAAACGARSVTSSHVRREIRLKGEVIGGDATAEVGSEKRRDASARLCALRRCGSIEERLKLEKLAYYQELVKSAGGPMEAAKRIGLSYSALYHRMERLRRQVEVGSKAADPD